MPDRREDFFDDCAKIALRELLARPVISEDESGKPNQNWVADLATASFEVARQMLIARDKLLSVKVGDKS